MAFIIVLICDTIVNLYKAWVVSWLWSWFIQGTLTEYSLTMVQAFGVIIVVDLLKANYSQMVKDTPEDWDDAVKLMAVTYALTLFGCTINLVFGFLFYKLFF